MLSRNRQRQPVQARKHMPKMLSLLSLQQLLTPGSLPLLSVEDEVTERPARSTVCLQHVQEQPVPLPRVKLQGFLRSSHLQSALNPAYPLTRSQGHGKAWPFRGLPPSSQEHRLAAAGGTRGSGGKEHRGVLMSTGRETKHNQLFLVSKADQDGFFPCDQIMLLPQDPLCLFFTFTRTLIPGDGLTQTA